MSPSDETIGGRSGWDVTRAATGQLFHLISPPARHWSQLRELSTESVVYTFVTPRRAPARFAQYLVELQPRGGTRTTATTGFEHFVYVLDGVVETLVDGLSTILTPGMFAYLPDDQPLVLSNDSHELCRLLWIKRRYEPFPGFGRPPAVCGDSGAFTEDQHPYGLWRRELLPADDPCRDFSISIMRFEAAGELGVVEMHDEEHGLFMTAGAGVYLLEDRQLPVEHEDFIYMAPYCPQGFIAGPEGGEYLLYKDIMRDGF